MFVLLQEQIASTKELVTKQYIAIATNNDHKIEPSLNTIVEEPLSHDPFLQSNSFRGRAEAPSDNKDTIESLPEEEPQSKICIFHTELVDMVA